MTKKIRKPAKPSKPTRPAKRAQAAKHAKAATQTVAAKKAIPAKPPGKVYVLFGADEYAKPRAARFTGEAPELLTMAAASMHLRLAEVTEPELAEIAAKLPAGRLHANAKGLVPYVKADLYIMFATLAGEAPQDLPKSWDELAPGHLVIAKETLEIGWWEAVVVERTGVCAPG
jgi:hypothetical protein